MHAQQSLSAEPTKQDNESPHKGQRPAYRQANSANPAISAGPIKPSDNLQTNRSEKTAKELEDETEYTVICGHKIKITDALLVLFTAILACVTAALIVVGTLQHRQLKRTVDTAERAEAPFLIPDLTGMEEETLKDGRTRPVAFYTLRNHGRSPGIVRRFQDTMTIRERLPDNYEEIWSAPLSSRPGQYMAIGPAHIQTTEGQSGMRIECALNPDDLGKSGRQYVIGRIQFEDLFGKSYIQGFCIQILKVTKTEKPNVYVLQHAITGDNIYNYRREETPS